MMISDTALDAYYLAWWEDERGYDYFDPPEDPEEEEAD